MDKKTRSAVQSSFWALNTSLDYTKANLYDIQEACDKTRLDLALVVELCVGQLANLKQSISLLQDLVMEREA